VKTEYIKLKETILNNNCPECYSQESLQLTFIQERAFSKFSVKVKKGITSTICCTKCHSEIYPGIWTDDIERVYNYHKKTVHPKPASFRITKLFYTILITLILLIAIGLVYVYRPELFSI